MTNKTIRYGYAKNRADVLYFEGSTLLQRQDLDGVIDKPSQAVLASYEKLEPPGEGGLKKCWELWLAQTYTPTNPQLYRLKALVKSTQIQVSRTRTQLYTLGFRPEKSGVWVHKSVENLKEQDFKELERKGLLCYFHS